jgi:hypothetical protein
MSKQVPYRKIVTISCDFSGVPWGVNARTFNTALAIKDPANNTVGAGDFKVDFIPDEMNVKSISYATNAVQNVSYRIWTSIINDNIAIIGENQSLAPQLTYKCNGPISSTYSFQLRDVTDTVSTNANGKIFLMLEFIKY